MNVSEGHREVSREEYLALAKTLPDLWHDPSVATQQRALVEQELAQLRAGHGLPVFTVLQELVGLLDAPPLSILEVGCASGYYHEVLKLAGWRGHYLGVDYSAALINLARSCHPGVEFRVDDATALGAVGDFDLVFTGACLMHIIDWRGALKELARVARGAVILHRTPIVLGGTTSYWCKFGYGRACLEQHFGEAEFLAGVAASGLRVVTHRDIGDAGMFMGRSYLCAKGV